MQVPSDVLLRLLGATEEIRDLLRQKADQENSKLKVLVPEYACVHLITSFQHRTSSRK